jgi:Domain of unknown function (DUF4157)
MLTHHHGKKPGADQARGAVHDAVSRPGQPLAEPVTGVMTPRPAADFAHVPVHTGDADDPAFTPPRSAVRDVLSGLGQPLAEPVREEMQARLGADFSDVRVHTGPAARAAAAELGARAFTSGRHVVIGDRGADKHTLAHELTHVIQQRQGPVAGTGDGHGLKLSDPSDHDEQTAEVNAARAMAAQPDAAGAASAAVMPRTGGTFPGLVIQRTPAEAAAALHAAGYVTVNKKRFGAWLKERPGKGPQAPKNAVIYGVTEADLDQVSQLLGGLKQQAAATRKIDAARAKLATAQKEAPGVHIDHEGVSVDLDTDQLKHQPPGYAIGTRHAAGGAIWPAVLKPDAAWHKENTLPVIGRWALRLNMQDGDDIPTKQLVALDDGNFYEGFCVQVDGQKHVFFHCYPPRGNK